MAKPRNGRTCPPIIVKLFDGTAGDHWRFDGSITEATGLVNGHTLSAPNPATVPVRYDPENPSV